MIGSSPINQRLARPLLLAAGVSIGSVPFVQTAIKAVKTASRYSRLQLRLIGDRQTALRAFRDVSIVLALFAPGMVSANVRCAAEGARYKLRGAPGVTAGFTRQRYQINYASKLFFWIRTSEGRRWWFSMNAPNGTGGVYITPDVDATKITAADHEAEPKALPESPPQVDFDAFDRNYNVTRNLPQVGDPAPAHLFARELGALLWYNPVGASNGDKKATSSAVPIGMFDLTTCASGSGQ